MIKTSRQLKDLINNLARKNAADAQLRICGLTVFGRICYNDTLGHTENGGRFDFQLPCI